MQDNIYSLRYSRQVKLDEVGLEGQRKLARARVLIVGCGGLGCPVAVTLGAAGIGKIGLVDYDVIEESNLNRQWLYGVGDIGRSKVECAAERIKNLSPTTVVEEYSCPFNSGMGGILEHYDVVVDCTDNFTTRYLINDLCVAAGKPFVSASIYRFEGQLSVFNYSVDGVEFGPTYRCLYPSPPQSIPSCAEGGVLGVVPTILGALQANEVLKIILGIGEILDGKLLLINTLTLSTTLLSFKRQIKEVLAQWGPVLLSSKELLAMLESKEVVLVDVRERDEDKGRHLGGLWLPLSGLDEALLPPDVPIVLYCESGKRSLELSGRIKRRGVYSLSHGIRGVLIEGVFDQIRSLASNREL